VLGRFNGVLTLLDGKTDESPRGNGRSSTVQHELHPAQGMEGYDDSDVPF
jgi:hypothetical protein